MFLSLRQRSQQHSEREQLLPFNGIPSPLPFQGLSLKNDQKQQPDSERLLLSRRNQTENRVLVGVFRKQSQGQLSTLRTHDDVVLRDKALLERLCRGVHHHLAARQPLAHVVVRVSLHLTK